MQESSGARLVPALQASTVAAPLFSAILSLLAIFTKHQHLQAANDRSADLPCAVHIDSHVWPVVQARPLQARAVYLKAKRSHKVQAHSSGCTRPSNRPCTSGRTSLLKHSCLSGSFLWPSSKDQVRISAFEASEDSSRPVCTQQVSYVLLTCILWYLRIN